MITYTIPVLSSPSADVIELQTILRNIIRSGNNPKQIIPDLVSAFKKYVPFDNILMTFTRNQPKEEWYWLYPEINNKNSRRHSLGTTREQFYAIQNGVKDIVRIATDLDDTINTGVIQKIFPGSSFSTIFIRTLFPENIILTFGFLHRGSDTVYLQQHAELLSGLFDSLLPFFKLCCQRPLQHPTINREENDLRFLPLHLLPGMKNVINQIWKVARQDCPVLLLGETGSGKEAAADTLYRASARVGRPFIKVNCGGLTESLIDSELFGHEKGAFTDAVHTVIGRFERAHRGVLMLDEVAELPLSSQTKLLRVLQENTIERVGGTEVINVDVRIIAATHKNLPEMVYAKEFRQDLFYRINVFPIVIPPLRERKEDIPLLTEFLLNAKCRRFGIGTTPKLSDTELKKLMEYPWNGNIRELNNAIERAIIMWGNDPQQTLSIIPLFSSSINEIKQDDGLCSLEDAVRNHIKKVLTACGGKISGHGSASEILALPPATLRSKMIKLGLLKEKKATNEQPS